MHHLSSEQFAMADKENMMDDSMDEAGDNPKRFNSLNRIGNFTKTEKKNTHPPYRARSFHLKK